MQEGDAPAERILKRFEKLKAGRHTWDSHWQETYGWTLPKGATFITTYQDGRELRNHVTDNTAPLALRDYVAGLMGRISSKSAQWFALETDDEFLNDKKEHATWLETATEIQQGAFSDPASQFYSKLSQSYEELGAGGNAAMWPERGRPGESLLFFRMYGAQAYYIDIDERGAVDTVFRSLKRTARQAAQFFGVEVLPEDIQEALSEGHVDKEFEFVHAVFPNEDYEPGALHKLKKAYASIYVAKDAKKTLKQGGFDRMPYAVGRWNPVAGEAYGRGPAMNALPSIRLLNAQKRDVIQLSNRLVDPAWMVRNDGLMSRFDRTPGAVNVWNARGGNIEPPAQMLDSGAQGFPITLEIMQQEREAVKEAFYSNLFLLLTGQDRPSNVTAFETMQQDTERNQLLADAVSRIESELLSPLIINSFYLLLEMGAIPEPPPGLQGANLNISYKSPYAKLQKQEQAKGIMQLEERLGMLAQLDPTVMDNYDVDEATHFLSAALGVPQSALRSRETVAQIREERAQAAQAEKQAIDAERAVEAGATAAKAGLLGGAGGAQVAA